MSSEENPGFSQNTGTLSELTVTAVQEESLGALHAAENLSELREENPVASLSAGIASGLQEVPTNPSPVARTAADPQEELSVSSGNGEMVPELQIELPNLNPEAPESIEIDTMLADMEALVAVPQGKVVKSKVVKITETEVRLNVGMGLEGVVPLSEFVNSDGQSTVAPGDEVGVWVERYNEKQGTVTVSRLKAARLEVWEGIERAFRDQTPITVTALGLQS